MKALREKWFPGICGSSPDALVDTKSAGIGTFAFSVCKVSVSVLTRSISFWLVGLKFEPLDAPAS